MENAGSVYLCLPGAAGICGSMSPCKRHKPNLGDLYSKYVRNMRIYERRQRPTSENVQRHG